jgi:hypothetical protein
VPAASSAAAAAIRSTMLIRSPAAAEPNRLLSMLRASELRAGRPPLPQVPA